MWGRARRGIISFNDGSRDNIDTSSTEFLAGSVVGGVATALLTFGTGGLASSIGKAAGDAARAAGATQRGIMLAESAAAEASWAGIAMKGFNGVQAVGSGINASEALAAGRFIDALGAAGGTLVGAIGMRRGMLNPCVMAGTERAIFEFGMLTMGVTGIGTGIQRAGFGVAEKSILGVLEGFSGLVMSKMALHSLAQACFAAGTPVETADGSILVEDVRVGDKLLARSEFDPAGEARPRAVEEVFVRFGAVWRLAVGGRDVFTTPEHPFFEAAKGWVPCQELAVGDRLRCRDGSWVAVGAVEDTGRWDTVYNFRIAEDHTYFVGCPEWGFGVWAHNATYSDVDARTARQLNDRIEFIAQLKEDLAGGNTKATKGLSTRDEAARQLVKSSRKERSPYEGYIPAEFIEENQAAHSAIRKLVGDFGSDVLIALENGGALHTDVLLDAVPGLARRELVPKIAEGVGAGKTDWDVYRAVVRGAAERGEKITLIDTFFDGGSSASMRDNAVAILAQVAASGNMDARLQMHLLREVIGYEKSGARLLATGGPIRSEFMVPGATHPAEVFQHPVRMVLGEDVPRVYSTTGTEGLPIFGSDGRVIRAVEPGAAGVPATTRQAFFALMNGRV